MKKIYKFCLLIGFLLTGYIQLGFAETRIALLIPLQGPYAAAGQAIRDGFIAAYYQSLIQDPSPLTIRIVDTSNGNILDLYKQAVEQGADFIVGPLNKAEGAELIQAGPLAKPTLLLNTLPLEGLVPNLYQFGLSPEDEAKQAADRAWREGHKKTLVIAPASTWGQRAFEEFINQWRKLGGQVVGEMYYDDPAQLSNQIAQLLHIEQSEQRSKELRSILQEPKIRAITYRRQDFDMVFLVAKPDLARELRPLLKFYYAGKTPVYATSHLYSGSPDPKYDQDLNGVRFCAIPWEVDTSALPSDVLEVMENIKKIWPKALQQQPQFFAFGVDSFSLAKKLSGGASSLPSNGLSGATGRLTLQSNKVWYRQLPWVEMVDGQPKLLSND